MSHLTRKTRLAALEQRRDQLEAALRRPPTEQAFRAALADLWTVEATIEAYLRSPRKAVVHAAHR